MRTLIIAIAVALSFAGLAIGQDDDAKAAKSSWRASKRGPVIEVSESGDTILATEQKGRRYLLTYELKKASDGSYKGFMAEEFSCRRDHFCRIESPMQASRVDDNTIEGRIFGVTPPSGLRRGNLFCDTCGKSEEANATWMEFVWVKDE